MPFMELFCVFELILAVIQNQLDMCLWNTDAPGGNKVKYGKNL